MYLYPKLPKMCSKIRKISQPLFIHVIFTNWRMLNISFCSVFLKKLKLFKRIRRFFKQDIRI